MNNRLEIKLWLLHRMSGMALGFFVVLHLISMIVVIQSGLSAQQILERTSGNYLLGLFYGLFVIAATLHGTIGLRTVAREVMGWRGGSLNWVAVLFCALLSVLGLSAIMGLVL